MYEKGNNNGAVDTYNVFKIIISKCILEMNIIYIYTLLELSSFILNLYIYMPSYHQHIILL